ncbi:MAG: class E sortase [Coriobacteriia bacterium]|nr:class E sortase [Coriobacteriia bacterium]
MKRSVRWRHAVGNLLLGVSIGLVAYYSLTTLVGWLAQRDLRDRAGDVASYDSGAPEGLLSASGPPMDFSGWAEEDRAYWDALPAGEAFGRLVIGDMGVDVMVVKGVTTADLRQGPGWIDWTDMPGPSGTCGISGHRTTYGAPFRRLDELTEGDTIDLYSPYRRYRYTVTRSLVVRPSQVEVVASTERPSLTLTACHPPYSATYRLAVQADLVDVRRVDGSTD